MAAASPVQGLQEDATCPICLDYYKDCVTTKCGHNFCRACITGCPGGAGRALPCPQCREICSRWELRPNRHLQSMVEFVKQLSVQRERAPGEGGLCEAHEERLKLFCEEDETLICVICQVSSHHKAHNVRPIQEAAQEYKSKLRDWLLTLRAEVSNALRTKLKEEQDCVALRNKLAAERMKIITEFEKLQQLLKEQKQTLLKRLEAMDKKITTFQNSKMAKLSAEVSSLKGLITEIEKKCEQPAGELLKEIRSTLSRCEHVMVPTPERIRKMYKEPVTLDEDTAHEWLTLSEAGRRVAFKGSKETPPKKHPKRFTHRPSVLGTEGFTSGRHYWELEMLQSGCGWRLGVAQESVSRKEEFTHCPEEGVWAVMWDTKKFTALTTPPTPLAPPRPLRRLGVYLDYEGGRLSVYNASTMGVVFTFTGATFRGRVWPYFWLWDWTDLRLV